MDKFLKFSTNKVLEKCKRVKMTKDSGDGNRLLNQDNTSVSGLFLENRLNNMLGIIRKIQSENQF